MRKRAIGVQARKNGVVGDAEFPDLADRDRQIFRAEKLNGGNPRGWKGPPHLPFSQIVLTTTCQSNLSDSTCIFCLNATTRTKFQTRRPCVSRCNIDRVCKVRLDPIPKMGDIRA